MEKHFKKDKADIVFITEYFVDSEYSEISIRKNNYKKGFMFTSTRRDVEIEDEAVAKAIDRILKKRGYKAIIREGNTIYFEKWILFEDIHGIAYSINEGKEPTLQFLIKLEPLSENGWYYYEEDYNEWRTR